MSTATDDRKICWLVERTGNDRFVWGPYTYANAVREKGSLYVVVGGSGLREGQSLSPGDVQSAYQSRRIYPVSSQAEAEEALRV